MAFPVQQLISHKQKPVIVSLVELADGACRIMREHGFSQLPVVSDKGVVLGLVTHESILRALGHLNVALDQLRVSAALTRPRMFFPDDDLFDLLAAMAEEYATLIIDKDEHLLGIVTQDDLLVYFRRRAEDMLLVEEIEMGLREHVLCAFSDTSGLFAREELCSAVDEVADQANRFRKKFLRALGIYNGATKQGPIDNIEADKAFKAFDLKYQAKEMTDLTFDETRALLLHERRWGSYGGVFGLEKKALSELLARVRDARNKLAHFRGDLSDDEREKLRFCAQFLVNHPPLTPVPSLSSIREVPGPISAPPAVLAPSTTPTPGAGPKARLSEEPGPGPRRTFSVEDEENFVESRYAPLISHLSGLTTDSSTLRFEEIEAILGRALPPAARQHRAWWANDRVSHAQSRLWLEAGWRVSNIGVTTESVTFSRIKGREDAYIEFFSRMLHEMQRAGSPNGGHWQVLEQIGSGLSVSVLSSFARGGRFRIELYLDVQLKDEARRKEANKRLFDVLVGQRDEIEGKIGHALGWERLDLRVASRIALYTKGSILDDKEELTRVVKWAAEMAPRFLQAIKPPTEHILESLAAQLLTPPREEGNDRRQI